MRKMMVIPLLALGVGACVSNGSYYDDPPARGGYYGSPGQYSSSPGYYGSSSRYPQSAAWDDGGQCTFQTRRGPVVGYKPTGKDRCCIETRHGPSCQ